MSGPAEQREHPRVSVVTPSYNMARYIEETIESVLGQDYPHLEYIVMDGGSADGTQELLRKYEGKLRFESRPDKGQADAINQGFQRSSGEIFAYLNADDTYLPGAVGTAVRHLTANPACGGVYGEGYHTGETGKILGRYPTRDFDLALLAKECFICQPAVFLRRESFAEAGMLDISLQFALDYDLWIRVGRRRPLLRIGEFLANSRMHRENKTLRARRRVFQEAIRVVRSHYGYVSYDHIYGYACALLYKEDGFFQPVPVTRAAYALAVLLGLWENRQHAPRFWAEAIAHSRFGGVGGPSAAGR